MATASTPNANDLFIALGHPLRRRILRKLIAEDSEASPRELSADLEEPLSKLSYHVTVLAQSGAIELVRTRQIHGSTEHFYRPTIEVAWVHSALGTDGMQPRRKPRGEENG